MRYLKSLACAAVILGAGAAHADGHIQWKSVDDMSGVSFGSVKKDVAGEVHHFTSVNGSVSEEGALEINIDLASVETYIDIRNERMIEHVFQKGAATAVVTGEIDMEEFNGLQPGDTTLTDVDVTLAFAGVSLDVEAEMLVARLTEDRVLVTTADFVMVSTEDLGINPGVDKLMELAELPGITRVAPVSVRMVFEK